MWYRKWLHRSGLSTELAPDCYLSNKSSNVCHPHAVQRFFSKLRSSPKGTSWTSGRSAPRLLSPRKTARTYSLSFWTASDSSTLLTGLFRKSSSPTTIRKTTLMSVSMRRPGVYPWPFAPSKSVARESRPRSTKPWK